VLACLVKILVTKAYLFIDPVTELTRQSEEQTSLSYGCLLPFLLIFTECYRLFALSYSARGDRSSFGRHALGVLGHCPAIKFRWK
jgi:hypothetical protein